jgi:hypothetical protein
MLFNMAMHGLCNRDGSRTCATESVTRLPASLTWRASGEYHRHRVTVAGATPEQRGVFAAAPVAGRGRESLSGAARRAREETQAMNDFPNSPQRRRAFGWRVFAWSLFFLSALLMPARAGRADEFSQASTHSIRLVRGTVVIDTRVGDIYIEGWDKARVEVEAEKVVRASSEKKSRPLFDRLRVHLSTDEEERTVYLKTLYPPRRLWRPFRGESRLTVNYRIKMPADANLILNCVDGDVRISGLSGNQQLKVNYGDVEIDVPSIWDLRSLQAHTWLGYVQSDLRALTEDDAGVGRNISFYNAQGRQEIKVHVRMGGVFVYGNNP